MISARIWPAKNVSCPAIGVGRLRGIADAGRSPGPESLLQPAKKRAKVTAVGPRLPRMQERKECVIARSLTPNPADCFRKLSDPALTQLQL